MKWLRLLARVRYWRSRALKAETRLIEVSADAERRVLEVTAQAEAESWRNRSREDMFVSAAVMGGRGMIGISPRQGPAELPQPPRVATVSDPWNALNGIELMEFQTQWLTAGLDKGLTVQQIREDYLRELAHRKAFNDEPSM